ncbi:MAG: phage integrase N-terminal SAM-like domain-containing protein [Betaproteobacteria bacterium]
MQSGSGANILDKNPVMKFPMKPGAPPLQSVRLLDQVREWIRYMHYSLATKEVYLYWVRFFIRWSGRNNGGQMRHPRVIDAKGVEAFLTMLATERQVSASTYNQALSAILFLYREVLAIDLPWLNGINRPTRKPRIPTVLTQAEVAGVLAQMEEGSRKPIDSHNAAVSNCRMRSMQKYHRAGQSWAWFWLFPSPSSPLDALLSGLSPAAWHRVLDVSCAKITS